MESRWSACVPLPEKKNDKPIWGKGRGRTLLCLDFEEGGCGTKERGIWWTPMESFCGSQKKKKKKEKRKKKKWCLLAHLHILLSFHSQSVVNLLCWNNVPRVSKIFAVFSQVSSILKYNPEAKQIISLLLLRNFHPAMCRWIQKEDESLYAVCTVTSADHNERPNRAR